MKINESIKKFAEAMQAKLNKNEHKKCSVMNNDQKGRQWKHCSYDWLLFRLRQEVMELEEAYMKNHEDIKEEAVDVANFAMMFFDNLNNER
jgi:NTP pyrophosphatase (non-canonical NTP hydrolase)